jgi:hypothetical protein
MPFYIINRRSTFLRIDLVTKRIEIGARGSAGPFPDDEWTADLTRKEKDGDVFTQSYTESIPAEKPPEKTTRRHERPATPSDKSESEE